jgi:hypothetical protein
MTYPRAYGSPVVGYIRSARLHDPGLDAAEELIRAYAQAHGLNLVYVFREEGISSVAAWRPELEKLIRGLERHDWTGVIIPDATHWSYQPSIKRKMQTRVEARGAWILNI